MALKLSIFLLVAVAFVTGHENEKRQSEPNLNEMFNKFKEQMKPFVDKFPQLSGNFGSASFPSFPGIGGHSGNQAPVKRQALPFGEWLNFFGQGNNGVSGNLPFKPPPPFGNLPFGGSSGSNGETSENQKY